MNITILESENGRYAINSNHVTHSKLTHTHSVRQTFAVKLTHPRVQISNISGLSIFVSDFYVLVGAGVNHHVPRVAVQAVSPVVVTLNNILESF